MAVLSLNVKSITETTTKGKDTVKRTELKDTTKGTEAKDTTKMKAVLRVAESNQKTSHTETPVPEIPVPITPGSAVAVVQRSRITRQIGPTKNQVQLTLTTSSSSARVFGDTNVKPTMRLTIQKSGDSQKGNILQQKSVTKPVVKEYEFKAIEEEIPQGTAEQKTLLAQLRERWKNRSPILKEASSIEWQNTQARFLWTLVLSDEERADEFNGLRDDEDWSYGTTSYYWSATIKCCEAVGMLITPAMRVHAKVLTQLRDEEDSRRPTTAMTKLMAEKTLEAMRQGGAELLAEAVEVAFRLGQRMGDVLQLDASQLSFVDDSAVSGCRFLGITFRRGKTVKRRQPYTLHLPWEDRISQQLWSRVTEGRYAKDGRLFVQNTARPAALDAIKTWVQKTDQANPSEGHAENQQHLGILSIRRGGLQQMALEGASVETLLHHSRHATVAMLNRYLSWGVTLLHAARERFQKQV